MGSMSGDNRALSAQGLQVAGTSNVPARAAAHRTLRTTDAAPVVVDTILHAEAGPKHGGVDDLLK